MRVCRSSQVESPGTSKSGGSGGNMRRPGSGEARAPGQPPLLHPQVQQVQRAAGLQLDGSRGRTVLPPTQEGDEQQEQHGSP